MIVIGGEVVCDVCVVDVIVDVVEVFVFGLGEVIVWICVDVDVGVVEWNWVEEIVDVVVIVIGDWDEIVVVVDWLIDFGIDLCFVDFVGVGEDDVIGWFVCGDEGVCVEFCEDVGVDDVEDLYEIIIIGGVCDVDVEIFWW